MKADRWCGDMWQRFTERARKVVFYAQEEAQKFGAGHVSTEHLLLGILRERDSVGYRAIGDLALDPATIQRLIEEQASHDQVRPAHDMTLTPQAKRVIDLAYDEARSLHNDYIGTEHVLLGIIAEGSAVGSTVLAKLGADISRARRAVLKIQDSDPLSQAPRRREDQNWVKPIVLEGGIVRLEPLAYRHATDLAEACDANMFEFFPTFPLTFDQAGIEDYTRARYSMPVTVPFAIVHKDTNKVIGSSSFFDIRPADKGLEVGHTWIKEEHRGTKVNPETKLLMLGHAFETLGAIRVQLKTDARNLQSQNAMRKLGAKEEGTLRHNMVMPDGFVRDSVYFSILAEEWPEVKSGLLVRLKT